MLKRILPRSLYGRTFLIILSPLVLVQVVTTYFFLDRHLQSVTALLANAIASEVSIAGTLYQKYPEPFERKEEAIFEALALKLNFLGNNKVNDKNKIRKKKRLRHPWADEILEKALRNKISLPFDLSTDENKIYISLSLPKGILEISLPHKRLMSKTTILVLLSTFASSVLFLLIALIFMRNQIRPIQKLAEAAEKFGKGQEISSFRSSGSLEVRRAAHAFLQMKERIQRQITQRMEFLAGISHDLRTPLTRMKLQLALLKSKKEREALEKDIQSMEYMIQEYLDFVRGEGQEKSREVSLKELMEDAISSMKGKDTDITLKVHSPKKKEDSFICNLRPQAIHRVLENLLGNACRYSKKLSISLERIGKNISIVIDDDGPGIVEAEREKVFRPFYRIDSSRNLQTGGVGLGLSIARDIIQAHGGIITLGDSPLGGLRVKVVIPT